MNFDTNTLSTLLKGDKVLARKILKAMALIVALGTANSGEVKIEYLGTLSKKSRFWSFKESEYFNTVRNNKMTPIEFLDSLLTEDDQLYDDLSRSDNKPK